MLAVVVMYMISTVDNVIIGFLSSLVIPVVILIGGLRMSIKQFSFMYIIAISMSVFSCVARDIDFGNSLGHSMVGLFNLVFLGLVYFRLQHKKEPDS